MDNYYDLLKLDSTAQSEEIKKAVHSELQVWTIRANTLQIDLRKEAERMVKALEQAESILTDPDKRAIYDHHLKTQQTT
jgi:DnaJ-class molecular chaperone